ncbi:beta-lactamase domain-containing protein [Candidatus Termititenax aidoneus]|uniref:Beta-lactamase domain-containing protein n=1 Tax=Termititenax aidoneus TaxID=2218524 RepID=A0A388TA90_TERA1|nr:beta-lactamase domain-containing protein [Candidatus Termititenax aidoneus]
MQITFLGTGTSNGIPMVACACAVCRSDNPRNKRLRSSVWLEKDGHALLIDASSDFRQQALTHNILDVDDVLITHTHADHVFGLDEFRRFNIKYQKRVNVYLSAEADKELRATLRYMYETPRQAGGGITALDNHILQNYQAINIGGFSVAALPIKHGLYEIFGYRVDDFAYLTDCSEIPEKTFERLKNLNVLVLDALRDTPHPTHFSLEQAVAAARRIGARQTYFTHIAHNLEHETTNKTLLPNMQLAYDGLKVII